MKIIEKHIGYYLLIFTLFICAGVINAQTTVTFNCTGGNQSWTVPPCVSGISVNVKGAKGGGTGGGAGSTVTGTLTVTPGQVLTVKVGCVGSCPGAGFGGGGAGQNATGAGNTSCGGGGASSIGTSIVAGGGGGMGGGDTDALGGNGGCASGSPGSTSFGSGATGGTQTAGGTGGAAWISSGNAGANGSFGAGGAGGSDPCFNKGPGGGGGGGYFGGGGGGSDCFNSPPLGGGGGAGGSSLTPPGGACTPGSNTGNGSVTITYTTTNPTVTVNSPTICAGQPATLTATVSPTGGTYSWNTGATTQSITVSPGSTTTYTVTYNKSGCITTVSGTVTVTALPSVSVNSTTICSGQSATLTATPTPAGGTYSWNTGAVTSSISVTPLSSATYTVTYTMGGCTKTASGTVTVNPLPISTFTYNGNQCLAGNSYNFTNTGTSAGATYSWTFPGGTPSTSTANNPAGVTWSAAGTYAITHIVTQGSCSSTVTQNIVVYAMPSATAVPANPKCNGSCNGSATVTGSGGGSGYSYSWSGGGTSATKSALCAGTYTVTVTDVNNCSATASATLVNPPALTATAIATAALCNGVCNGALTASAGGGTTSYTYNWSNSLGTGANKTNVCAGTYTVTATDANNCTFTASATVTQPVAIGITTSATPATCNGTCNGTVSSSGSGGSTPYTYTWSGTLGTGANKTSVCAGTFTVTIKDANNCSNTASVTVNQPSVITATATTTPVSCNGGSNGSAGVSVSGGTTSYSYNWSNGTTSTSLSGLVAGSYTVTVTDGNNCTKTATATVTAPSALTASTIGTAASCNGLSNGTATASAAGGTSPWSYQWSGNANFQTIATATGLAAGTYTVTVTDSKSCTATSSFTVVQPTAIVVSTSTANSTCSTANGSATATASGGTTAYSYLWSGGGTSSTKTGLLAGSYTVTVTDANGCTKTATASVADQNSPSSTISSSSNVSCFGGNNGSATVSVSGGATPYSYSWSPSGGTQPTANALVANNYCVNVTDSNGCITSACVNITQPSQLNGALIASTDASCNGMCNGTATVGASGGASPYNYLWASGNTTASSSGLCAGSHNVNVTDSNGCGKIIAFTIAQPAALNGTANGGTTLCAGACNGSANLSVSGGTSLFSFSWDNGETTQNAASLCSGSHSVTITDSKGCTDTAAALITEPAILSVTTTTANSSCGQSNGAATAAAAGGSSPYSYTWSTAPQQTAATATGLAAGTYTVSATDTNGCVIAKSVIVNNSSGGTATAVVTGNISGAGLCDGKATASMSGGTSPYTYLWPSSSGSQTTALATGLCSGTYCVTITDSNSCADVACVTISQPPAIGVTVTVSSALCNGSCNGTVNLSVTGGVTPYSYSWSNGATVPNLSNLCNGTYIVTVSDANGITITKNASVTQPPPLIASSSVSSSINCFGNCTGGATSSASGGVEPYTFLWSNGDIGLNADSLCAGNYTVTVTDVNNCTSTATFTVTQPASLALTFSTNNSNCGSPTGSAMVSVSGGLTPYFYAWSGGSTTDTQSSIAAGNHTVTVTDTKGCSFAGSVVVNNNAAGVPSAVVNKNVSCNGGADGQATAYLSGGTTPYTYSWGTSPVKTTSAVTGLSAGIFQVTITDANCSVITNVTVTEPSQMILSATIVDATCYGYCNGALNAFVSGGVSPYTYQWNDPGFQVSQVATGLCAGTFSVTATDANGCTKTNTFIINQNQDITFTTTYVSSSCGQANGKATVNIINGPPVMNYQWPANAGSQTTSTATGLAANCYGVTLTDGNGCSKIANVCVTDTSAPVASVLSQTNAKCFGSCDGFAQISVSGGLPPYTYLWLNANSDTVATTASVSNLCAGTYNGSLRDSSGCLASVSVTINQPSLLAATIASQVNASCAGSCNGTAAAAVAGGSSPYSYLWNNVSGSITPSVSALCQGNYTVIVTDVNNCTKSVTATISQPVVLSVAVIADTAYCNTPSGKATATVSGGSTPYSYLWNDSAVTAAATAANLPAGSYNVTVTDSKGCTVTASAVVPNKPPGNLTTSLVKDVSCNPAVVCDGQITVSMGGGTSPFAYQWKDSSGVSLSFTSATATGLCKGTYSVSVTDSNNCVTSATVTVASPAPLSITKTVSGTSCYNSCDGTAEAGVMGGTTPYSYLWNDPLAQTFKKAKPLCGGVWSVTVTDFKGCSATDTFTIPQPPLMTLTPVIANANCGQANGSGCVIISGGIGPYTFLWPDGKTTQCASALLAGTYNVTVSDANSCVLVQPLAIQNLGAPTVSVTSQANVMCSGNCTGSAAVSVTGGISPYSYLWSASAGSQTLPNAGNLCSGLHSIVVTDSAGCSSTLSITINSPAPLAYFLSTNNPVCYGDSNGTASVTVTGGSTPYSYLWNDPSATTNDTAINLKTGNYVININDSNGCVLIANATLGSAAQITSMMNTTNITCKNLCNGKATVTPANGIVPYTYLWSDPNNQTGIQANGLCAGSFTVTITDANSCKTTATAVLTQPSLLTTSIGNFGNPNCNALCNGYAQVSVSGGTTSYTYQWSDGQISQVASNLCAGNYTVTVKDANNCTSQATVVITQPPPIAVSVGKTNVTCGGACDGKANAIVSGGSNPYSYLWGASAGFQTTLAVTGLCVGSYSVEATDANGCKQSAATVIIQPNPLSLIISQKIDANCGQNNGKICINSTGGTAPYTYQWNDPNTQTSSCAMNLNAGCHSVLINDANGCTTDSLICINDIAGPAVTLVSFADVNCKGDSSGSLSFNVTGGTMPYSSVVWLDGNGAQIPADSGSFSDFSVVSGTYTIAVTDAAGCLTALSQFISEPPVLVGAVTSLINVTCNGACNGQATVSSAGGISPYSYSWLTVPSQTTTTATGLCVGTYSVIITDIKGCTKLVNTAVTQPQPIVISANAIGPSCSGSCNGQITTLTSGGTQPYAYVWTPAGGSNSDVFGLCAETYTVSVTDAKGCTKSSVIPISEPVPLIATPVSVSSTCGNCNGTSTPTPSGGTSAYAYQWENSQTGATATGLCAGSYTVTITDLKACSLLQNVTVTDIPGPQITALNVTSPTCFGMPNGSITVTTNMGTSPFTYKWSDVLGQVTSSAFGLAAGNYCVTVTDSNLCKAVQCTNLTQPVKLVANGAGADTICYGSSVQIWATATGGTLPYTITWKGSASGFNGAGPHMVSPVTTTDYCFNLTDSASCIDSSCINIKVLPELVASTVPAYSLCVGDTQTICVNALGGNGSAYTFNWNDGYSNVSATSSCRLTSLTASTTLNYSITVSDGCSVSDTVQTTITANPNPTPSFVSFANEGCPPLSVAFVSSSPGVPNSTYQWDFNEDGITDANDSMPSYTFTKSGMFDVKLTVVSSAGCDSTFTIADYVKIWDVPTARFTASPLLTTILNPSISFNATATTGADSITWNFGDTKTGNDYITDHVYPDTGTFTVKLSAVTVHGCRSDTSQNIKIVSEFAIFVPNAFTPDADGKNDSFFPLLNGFDRNNFALYIFDRWGELIYQTNNISNPWDGKRSNNEPVKQDVYVWMIETNDSFGNARKYLGHVTVVR